MKCPFCRVDNDKVIDSRACQDGFSIRRRRECLSCKRRYTTYERIEEAAIKVVKRDGSRETLSRDKIKQGLERACWKRPISDRDIERCIAAIENDVYSSFDSEIESQRLGELVMEHLRDLDEVAFVRFASVYRQFADAGDFVDELRPFLSDRKTPR
ncbi:MAG: transcriptional repressor NrdR [Planctomycetales bacterium]|nr:transcriptional repressor NrdR [Planctomycetales bacterium]